MGLTFNVTRLSHKPKPQNSRNRFSLSHTQLTNGCDIFVLSCNPEGFLSDSSDHLEASVITALVASNYSVLPFISCHLLSLLLSFLKSSLFHKDKDHRLCSSHLKPNRLSPPPPYTSSLPPPPPYTPKLATTTLLEQFAVNYRRTPVLPSPCGLHLRRLSHSHSHPKPKENL
ncbi:unnamed protein product [Lactuca virosa]|uniref:Uncharacterized protein n=1 Tax=Lactuca virosa TaxID=75947 RepID=A0AAU9LSH7_9ASTR|nr:unnamed protein product [Lactuca virosa]